MNAAETSASSAIADWTPLAVVWRSCTTAEIDTFISDVSTTSTNIAIASRIASRSLPVDTSEAVALASVLISADDLPGRKAFASPWKDEGPPRRENGPKCAGEDLNLHGVLTPQGPQPCASTNSATSARGPL